MTEISKAMGRIAGKVVPPDQMRAMMGEMMQTVFASMTLDDRIAFVAAMLPQCLGAIFDNLDGPARERLATAMAEEMASVARTAAEGSER